MTKLKYSDRKFIDRRLRSDFTELEQSHVIELERLFKLLKGSKSFNLIILEYNNLIYRNKIIEQINENEKKSKIIKLNIKKFKTFYSLEKTIKNIGKTFKILHLINVEDWFFNDKSKKIILQFNYHRESIANNYNGNLLLWLNKESIKIFATSAPDLWSWRSGVFEFSIKRISIEIERSFVKEFAKDSNVIDNYSLKEKKKRLNKILDYIEDISTTLSPNILVSLLDEAGYILSSIGEYTKAFEKYTQSLNIEKGIGNRGGIAISLHQLGMIHQHQGDYEKAINKYNESVNIKRELGDKSGIAKTLHQLGMIHHVQGDYEKAIEKYNESLKIKRELGDKSGIAIFLHQLGMIHHDQGDYEKAIEKYKESLKIAKELGDKSGIANTLHQLANIHYVQGDYEKAIEKYNESLKIVKELGDKGGIAISLHQLGMIHQLQGDYEQAIKMYNESLKIAKELGDKGGIAKTLHQLGTIHQLQGKNEQAIEKYNESLKIKRELGDKDGIAKTLGQFGRIFESQNKYREALKYYLNALSIFDKLKSPYKKLAQEDINGIKKKISEKTFKKYFNELNKELQSENIP